MVIIFFFFTALIIYWLLFSVDNNNNRRVNALGDRCVQMGRNAHTLIITDTSTDGAVLGWLGDSVEKGNLFSLFFSTRS